MITTNTCSIFYINDIDILANNLINALVIFCV